MSYAGLKARLGPFQRAEVFGNVDRVRLQLGQVDHLQRPGVGCGQHHRRSDSGVMGLSPTFGNDTPPIAGSETGKAVLRHRCDQVVADVALMIKKFSCQHSAHQMESVRWTRGAAAVAIEARKRICTARLQLGTEDICFTVHSPSVSKGPRAIIPVRRRHIGNIDLRQGVRRCYRSLGNDSADPVVDRCLPDPLPDTTAVPAGTAVGSESDEGGRT